MTGSLYSTSHLDDAELVRLLDREHSPDERAHWEAHVAACTHCTAEVDRLRADADVVRGWLDRAAFEQPLPHLVERAVERSTRVAPAPWLRAAAMIALIALPVTAVAAIPPLRAWLIAAIEDLRGTADVDVATPARQAAEPVAVDVIHFAVAPGSFTVQLDAAQPAGTLRITYGQDATGALDDPGVEAVFSETLLRVRNTVASDRSYTLRVPLSVTSVTVRIGTRTIAVLDAAALRTGRELPVR
jgi:hypothetical protein